METDKKDKLLFFKISNLIEGIEDEKEDNASLDFFEQVKHAPYKEAMFSFHSKMNYLNSYCTAGRLRNYLVYVGGRECDNKDIEKSLNKLFKENPDTWEKIKEWHIKFETIHPFGDGNGRVGRFLMLMQAEKHGVDIPEMFFYLDNFKKNRQEYYSWFK